jgi:rubrerythrin
MKDWPETCRGIEVGQLRRDAEAAITEVLRLGREGISEFDNSLLKPVQWSENQAAKKHVYICDRCGYVMAKRTARSPPNCGNRFDCSDLNIYFD